MPRGKVKIGIVEDKPSKKRGRKSRKQPVKKVKKQSEEVIFHIPIDIDILKKQPFPSFEEYRTYNPYLKEDGPKISISSDPSEPAGIDELEPVFDEYSVDEPINSKFIDFQSCGNLATTKKIKHYSIYTSDDKIVHVALKDMMIQYKFCNKRSEYPMSTDLCCLHCCHKFNTPPCFIPTKVNTLTTKVDEITSTKNIYTVDGNFCSWNCALSYNRDYGGTSYGENASFIYMMVKEIYGNCDKICDKDGYPFYAPNKRVIDVFGGRLTIKEYRALLSQNSMDVNIIYPPMISVIPQMEEINYEDIVQPTLETAKTSKKDTTFSELKISMGL